MISGYAKKFSGFTYPRLVIVVMGTSIQEILTGNWPQVKQSLLWWQLVICKKSWSFLPKKLVIFDSVISVKVIIVTWSSAEKLVISNWSLVLRSWSSFQFFKKDLRFCFSFHIIEEIFFYLWVVLQEITLSKDTDSSKFPCCCVVSVKFAWHFACSPFAFRQLGVIILQYNEIFCTIPKNLSIVGFTNP